MSNDVREQIREIAEFQQSNRRPIELRELDGAYPHPVDVIPRRRVSGPLVALGVMTVILVLVGGLSLLVNPTEITPPADTVTPTTILPTTTPTDIEGTTGIVTNSDGPLSMTVEWTELPRQDSIPYHFPMAWGQVAFVDSEYVVVATEPDGSVVAGTSTDGFVWTTEPLLPGSRVTNREFGSHPLVSVMDGLMQVTADTYDWPHADGVPSEAFYAWYDGTQWHQGSYRLEEVAEFVDPAGGVFDQHWACVAPDGQGGVINTWLGNGPDATRPTPEQTTSILVAGDDSTPIPRPVGSNVFCLTSGIYTVRNEQVFMLTNQLTWEPVGVLPDMAEPNVSWSDQGTYMHYANGTLWMTGDFETWETTPIPESLQDSMEHGVIINRDDIWMLVEGTPFRAWMPSEGLWVSDDLQEWELLPHPNIDPSYSVSTPIHGLFVSYNETATSPLWIGHVTR